MVVCPKCGYPQDADYYVMAERDVVCKICAWSGPSSEMLEVVDDGRFTDPRVFEHLYSFLHKEIAPVVGRSLVQLGLISNSKSGENIEIMARVLSAYTREGFGALVKGVMGIDDRGETDRGPDLPS